MDGWGAKLKKNVAFPIESRFLEKKVISFFGKYETSHFTEEVDVCKAVLKKNIPPKMPTTFEWQVECWWTALTRRIRT